MKHISINKICLAVLLIFVSSFKTNVFSEDNDDTLWFYKNTALRREVITYMSPHGSINLKTSIETDNTPLKSSGYAVYFPFENAPAYSEGQINRYDIKNSKDGYIDISDYKNGYLNFDIYISSEKDDTAETDNFRVCFRNRNNYELSKIYSLYDVKLNAWQSIKIPVRAMLNSKFDPEKLYRLSVINNEAINGKCEVYIQNIRFTKGEYSVTDISDTVNWSNAPIGGGGMITGLVFHPAQKDILYARTDVGGAYRYDFKLKKWIPLLDSFDVNLRNYYGVYGIGLDPSDPNIIYLAVGCQWHDSKGTPTVLKSTDRGKRWSETGITASTGMQLFDITTGGYYGECIAVDPNDSQTVYCGTVFDGLYVSRDGGATWSKNEYIPDEGETSDNTKYQGIHCVVVDSGQTYGNKSKKVYVGQDGFGIYASEDGGNTFSLIPDSPKRPQNMRLLNGNLYVTANVGGSGKIYEYNGADWSDITPSDANGVIFGGFAIKSDADNNTVLFVSELKSSKIYCKKNNADWFLVSDEFTLDNTRFYPFMSWKGRRPGVHNTEYLAINPFPDNAGDTELYIATGDGLYTQSNPSKSEDESIRYYANTCGIEETCVNTVVSHPSGDLLVGIMDYSGYNVSDLSSYAKTTNIIKTTDNKYINVISSFDYCENNAKYTAAFCDMAIPDTSKVEGFIVISSDGGKTWQSCNYPKKSQVAMGDLALAADVSDNGFPVIVAASKKINENDASVLRSEDFGVTWSECSGIPSNVMQGQFNLACNTVEPDRVDKNCFYVYDNLNGDFYVSDDAGKNFKKTFSFMPEKADYSGISGKTVRANPSKAGEVYITVGSKGLYKSTDYGKTFSAVYGIRNIEGFSFGAEINGIPCMYVLADLYGEHGMYVSHDNGLSWSKMNNSDNGLGCFAKLVEGDKNKVDRVYVATGGRGVITGGTDLINSSAYLIYDNKMQTNIRNGLNTVILTGAVGNNGNSKLVIGLYDKNKLVKIVAYKDLQQNENAVIDFNLENITDDMYIKCFNWSSNGTITPYNIGEKYSVCD